MIIRKPYAFLIKNFKKVHIFLFALAIYVYFKSTQTYTFVKEFIRIATYDAYYEPISDYINFFGNVALLLLIIGSGAIALLLRKKEKPWKLYLIPVVQYILIIVSFSFIKGYFNAYTGVESTAPLRAWRDLLLVSQVIQFFVLLIYIIRIIGVDLNKFNFKLDEEYLELEQADKEELEININIDKNSFKRTYNKLIRNLNYVYQEHKLFCRIVIIIFIIVMGRNTMNYINSHKSYKEGKVFDVNGYTVKINNSYYSDKSYNGEVISKKSSFVVVDLSITNNVEKKRKVDFNKFHIMNGISNYAPTQRTYETEFQDYGKAYDTVSLRANQTDRVLLIFKVNKDLAVNRFILTYQELNGNIKNLRKIELDLKDVSKIVDNEVLNLGDSLVLEHEDDENLIIDRYEIGNSINYTYRTCNTSECSGTTKDYYAPAGYKALTLSFGSDTYESAQLSNFVTEYGKVVYTTADGKKNTIDAKNLLNSGYYGKFVYLKVPEEIETATSIYLEFIIRNNKFIYKIL